MSVVEPVDFFAPHAAGAGVVAGVAPFTAGTVVVTTVAAVTVVVVGAGTVAPVTVWPAPESAEPPTSATPAEPDALRSAGRSKTLINARPALVRASAGASRLASAKRDIGDELSELMSSPPWHLHMNVIF